MVGIIPSAAPLQATVNAGSPASSQGDKKEKEAAAGAVGRIAAEQFNADRWNPVLEVPGFKPFSPTFPLDFRCPITLTSFKELAVPFVKAQRRYFIAMLDCGETKTICDASAAHGWLANSFTDPLTRQAVTKVHYYVTLGNPVFKHFLTSEKVSPFMTKHVLANSTDQDVNVQKARMELLSMYKYGLNNLKNEADRKGLDPAFVQWMVPGFNERETKINDANIHEKLDAEFIYHMQLVLNQEPKRPGALQLLEEFLEPSVWLPKRIRSVVNVLGHLATVQGIIARAYFWTNNYVQAAEHSRLALQQDDSLLSSHAVVGSCFGFRGDVEVGILYLRDVLRKYAENPSIYIVQAELAALLVKADKMDEALALAKESCKTPGNWVGMTLLGVIYSKMKAFDYAETHAQQALQLKASNIDALVTLSNSKRSQGRLVEAKSFSDKAVDLVKKGFFQGFFGLAYLKESLDEILRVERSTGDGTAAEIKELFARDVNKTIPNPYPGKSGFFVVDQQENSDRIIYKRFVSDSQDSLIFEFRIFYHKAYDTITMDLNFRLYEGIQCLREEFFRNFEINGVRISVQEEKAKELLNIIIKHNRFGEYDLINLTALASTGKWPSGY